MLKANYDSSITNLKTINIHYSLNLETEIYSFIQLENGLIVISLGNGSINFYKKDNLLSPFYTIIVDQFPITNIIQLKNDSILCTSNCPAIFIINKNPQNNNEYEIEKKIKTKSQGKQINKIIELPNENLISIDNCFITLWSNNFDIIKEKKINSPIIDIIMLNKKRIACALPIKKLILYIENEKLNQEYEFKNIKFINSLDFNNIFSILNDELLFVGGCLGCIYLINLQHKEFIANLNLINDKQIITSIYNLVNGDLLCGVSLIFIDDEQVTKVDSNLIQYKYNQYQNSLKEVSKKTSIHSNIIRNIREIINHKDMKELVSISLDGKEIIWN